MSMSFVSADQIAKWKSDLVRVLEQIPSEQRMYIWELSIKELEERERKIRERILRG